VEDFDLQDLNDDDINPDDTIDAELDDNLLTMILMIPLMTMIYKGR